jgi:hypothetical protein
MLAGDGPMTVLGVTDPRSWRPVDWVADVLPHFAYAVVAAAATPVRRLLLASTQMPSSRIVRGPPPDMHLRLSH